MINFVIQENNNEVSTLTYIPNYFSPDKASQIRAMLCNTDDWQGGIRNEGKNIDRKQKWYQTEKQTFCKEWKKIHERWESFDYSPFLLDLQKNIQIDTQKYLYNHKSIQNPNINSLLINYYKNGNEFIPPHQDNKLSFGSHPTILLLSFGATRKFVLERTFENTLQRNLTESHLDHTFDLDDNSLFIMAGSVQKYYCHSIKQSTTPLGGIH